MAFRWEEFLNAAYILAPDAQSAPEEVSDPVATLSDEARYRLAISRAYYGALGVCREHIKKDNLTKAPDKQYTLSGHGTEHLQIREFFLGNGDKTEDQLGKLIALRHKADYKLGQRLNWKSEATKALSYADAICQKYG